MKGKILAICTQEPEYARGLSEYILGRRELLFQVMVFLDLEKLRQFISEHRVDLLLLDDIYTTGTTIDTIARKMHKKGVERVYFLTISIGQGF